MKQSLWVIFCCLVLLVFTSGCSRSKHRDFSYEGIAIRNVIVNLSLDDGSTLKFRGALLGPDSHVITYVTDSLVETRLPAGEVAGWNEQLEKAPHSLKVLVGEPTLEPGTLKLSFENYLDWSVSYFDRGSGLMVLRPSKSFPVEDSMPYCSSVELLDDVIVPMWRESTGDPEELIMFYERGYVSAIIDDETVVVTVPTQPWEVGYPVFSDYDGSLIGVVSEPSRAWSRNDAGYMGAIEDDPPKDGAWKGTAYMLHESTVRLIRGPAVAQSEKPGK